jgi:hypothetical protein
MEGTLEEEEVEYEIWFIRSIAVARRIVRVACNQTWSEDQRV